VIFLPVGDDAQVHRRGHSEWPEMMKRCWQIMWIYRISLGDQRSRPADLKSQGKVNLCGVESSAHNLRQLAIAVTPLSIIGSDDQRMVSIKCRFEGAKRQSFQNETACRRCAQILGRRGRPANPTGRRPSRLAEICQRRCLKAIGES
jgi:hypothetical protein